MSGDIDSMDEMLWVDGKKENQPLAPMTQRTGEMIVAGQRQMHAIHGKVIVSVSKGFEDSNKRLDSLQKYMETLDKKRDMICAEREKQMTQQRSDIDQNREKIKENAEHTEKSLGKMWSILNTSRQIKRCFNWLWDHRKIAWSAIVAASIVIGGGVGWFLRLIQEKLP